MTELPHDPDGLISGRHERRPHQHGMPPDGTPPGSESVRVTVESVRVTVESVRVTAWVRGHVQGVGFRWWTRSQALELGLVGTAGNLSDGRVEVVAQGSAAACTELLRRLEAAPGNVGRRPGRVDGVTHRWSAPREGVTGFAER